MSEPSKPQAAQDRGTEGHGPLALLQFGPFVLDPGARELRRGPDVLKTTHKMFDLLSLLLQNRHRVVPHAELIESVWPRVHVSPGVLPQMVRKLRMVLDGGQILPGSGWIQGSRGVGYRFVGLVERVAVPAAADRQTPASPETAAADAGLVLSRPSAPTDSREQALYERARNQARRDDLEGLAATISELRFSDFSGSSRSHRSCLVWADIFDSHLERLKGNSKNAWHHLESAQLMLEGLEAPQPRCELHSQRGLYFETFTTEVEALAEFETAWLLAQSVDDLRLRAGCAARLAFAFGRTFNWPAFETWTRRSLELAATCGSRSIWLRHTVAAAMGWMDMGRSLAAAANHEGARQAWAKALRLNESVLGEPEDADVSARTRRIAGINRLALLARLQPECLDNSVAGLRAFLTDESRPDGRIQLLHELASLLHGGGHHGDAAALCLGALDTCRRESINECRDELLALSADIATAQGDFARANTALRELLLWRGQQAAEQAQRVAAITAVRLDTERALTLAEADRRRVEELMRENSALRRRAAMVEGGTEPAGLVSLASFERLLAQVWASTQTGGNPLCLAVIGIDPSSAVGWRPGQPLHEQQVREAGRRLMDICRDGDTVVALPSREHFGLVFDGVGLAQALAVCERIREALFVPARAGESQSSATVAVADVSQLASPTAAMQALLAAVIQAQRAGGNRVCGLPQQSLSE